MDNILIEHYKILKQEQQNSLNQVQQLWIFKLTALGIVLAVGVFSDKINGIATVSKETIVALSLIALPLIAIVIDVKVLEHSLQIKAISAHLIRNFKEVPEIYDWESNLWATTAITKKRTFFTIASSLGLSSIILLLSFIFASIIHPAWSVILLVIGSIIFLLLLASALLLVPKLLK